MYEVIMKQWPLKNKWVVMRADLNVPLDNGVIGDTWRLERIMPTLDYLLQHHASIVLIGHIGRPKLPLQELSTFHLMPFFKEKKYAIAFAQTIQHVVQLQQNITEPTIVLLENLRFLPQEKTGDILLAQQLAQLGSYFVQDAFGSLHNNDTSIILLPEQFQANNRSIGFLVEQEITTLDHFISLKTHKKVLIAGGSKVKEKIPYLIKISNVIPNILLTPPLACTFLAAHGKNMGNSLIAPAMFEMCKQFMQYAHTNNVNLQLPIDFLVEQDGVLRYTTTDQVPHNATVLSIGKRTEELFCNFISTMDAGVFNGPSGFIERPETIQETIRLLKTVQQLPELHIIAGGDSVLFAQNLVSTNNKTYLSTGGGATLYYIGNNNLPGLHPFNKADKNLTGSSH